MPPLCEDRLEVLVVWEAAVAHNDASSYVSQQMMANDEVLTNPIHDTWLHQGEISRTMCTPGLHESLQPCSRAARKWRENEEMKRKRRGNGERMRKWRKNFLILSLYPPSLSISYIKIGHILSQNVKYGIFVANVTKTEHTYEEIILGQILCEEAPQVVTACRTLSLSTAEPLLQTTNQNSLSYLVFCLSITTYQRWARS